MLSLQTIEQLRAQIEALTAADAQEVETLRIRYISRNGLISQLFEEFKQVSTEEKRILGKPLSDLKAFATDKINALREGLSQGNHTLKNDLTRPGIPYPQGSRHPINAVKEEICNIFARLGFSIAQGPEIEDDLHVFESLNFAADHPARDMQDTFYISHNPDVLLRTHTSSVQTRVMTHRKPPIRVLCPGRVYRNEAISARAHCFFHQIEGLYIDKGVSYADLREALFFFARELFGSDTKIRLRPSYFPFTEPSAEMDISCNLCGGKGCAFCKNTGWVEILGCGMVDPNVLRNCGIDPQVYSGYAFGLGVERITNLKYRVKDLRYFSENDILFLDQFRSVR